MMKRFSRFIPVLLFLTIITAILVYDPNTATAASAWTNTWKTIGSAAGGGPAEPYSIAADQQGNVYVTSNGEIDKLPNGSTQWQTLSKTGLSPNPDSIAVDKDGNLYIADSGASVVQKLPNGRTEWGNIGGSQGAQAWVPGERVFINFVGWVDSSGFWTTTTVNNGQIYVPLGLAVDDSLNVYVTNQGNYSSTTYYHSCERLQNGTWSVIGNQYNNNLYYIEDVAVDISGSVYVSTAHSSATREGRDAIMKYDGTSWSTIAYTGTNDPIQLAGLAVDKWGNIYVISQGDHTVKVFSNGQWKNIGGYGIGGPSQPTDVAVDGSGNVYVTDSTNNVVMMLQAPATKLVWLTQPGSGIAGQKWGQPPAVALVDDNGNVETGDSSDTVTLTLNNANGAAISNATVKLQNGVATFDNLTVNAVGSGYTLTPSSNLSAGLTVQTSTAFNMTAPPGPTVTGVSPASGVGGTSVTITGSNLTAASLVEFGSLAGVNLVVNSDTSVTVTAPTQAAGIVDVRVTTPGGKSPVNSPADHFTYNQPGAWAGAWTIIGDSVNGGFQNATGIAADSGFNIYAADQRANRLEKLSGSTWSNVSYAAYNSLNDVVVDGSDVYTSDDTTIYKNGAVIGSFTASTGPLSMAVDKNHILYTGFSGKVKKWDGAIWTDLSYDGNFSLPWGIAVDSGGNLYVSDSTNNVVKKLTAGGTQWTTIGTGFNDPQGLTIDSFGNLYLADYMNSVVRELPVGTANWISIGLGFYYPRDVAVDSLGNLYVTGADAYGKSLVARHQAPATRLVWQTQPSNGYTGLDLQPYPTLVLMDAYGNIVTGDSLDTVTLSLSNANGALLGGTTTVRMVNGVAHFVNLNISQEGTGYILKPSCSLNGITLSNSNPFDITAPTLPPPLALTGGWTVIGDYNDGFRSSAGVAVDNNSYVYAVNCSYSGSGFVRNSNGDGNWYNLQTDVNYPFGVAVDNNLPSSNVYVADTNNFRVTQNGTTLGGGFYSAAFNYLSPMGVAVDANRYVYTVGKGGSAGGPYVLKWNGSVWSNITYYGDFSFPKGIAADSSGSLYVTDSAKGTVLMLPAGTTQWKVIGTGFSTPIGVAVDGSGNVYVADSGNNVVKVLQPGKTQWQAMSSAGLTKVWGLALDGLGNFYATDNGYNVYKHQAPATRLVWHTQPGGGTGGTAWSQQPVLYLEDSNGSIVTNDSSSTVSVELTDVTGTVLGGTTQVTLHNGTATFSGLRINATGTYVLKASCGNIKSADSNPFDITLGPAARLTWYMQPGGGDSGETWTGQPVLFLEDAGGNLVSESGATVTLALADPGGNALDASILKGTAQAALQNGVAAFADLYIQKSGSYTLIPSISLAGVTAVRSDPFTVAPGEAAKLEWHTKPGGGTGGITWVQQPELYLEDAYGNIIASDSSSTVTVGLTSANGAVLGGTAQVTVKNGVASFKDLKVDKAGTYTLTPSSSLSGISCPVSENFSIGVGSAARLVWNSQPGGGTSGQSWPQQPVISLVDAGGNILENDSSTKVTLTLKSGNSAVLDGVTEAILQNGTASFSGLSIGKAGNYTISAVTSITGVTSPDSVIFTINPGAAAQLVWHIQPGGGTGGTVWAQQPVLYLEDTYGNIETGDSSSVVTLSLVSDNNSVLGGTTQVSVRNGEAVFTDLKIDKAGTYKLTAGCGTLTSAGSSSFDINLGPAARLVWQAQPVGAVSGSVLGTQPVLCLTDAGGNIKTDDNSSTVTVSLTNPGGVVLYGVKSVTVTSGTAIFTDLSMEKAGSYTLTAGSGSLTSAASSSFTILPGAADHFVWQVQPGAGTGGAVWQQQPVLALEDSYDNLVTYDSSTTVTVTLKGANGAALHGTFTKTLQSGMAAFNDLKVDRAGTYALSVTSSLTGISCADSDPFIITVGNTAMLVWHTQPAGAASGNILGTQPVLYLEDAGGNIRTDDNSSVVSIELLSQNGAVLAGTKTVTVTSGTAIFTDLEVDKAGSYALSASYGGILSPNSSSFTIIPGDAVQLTWKTQPGNADSGSDLSPQPVILLEDAYGNVVTYESSSTVTIALTNPGSATLTGTLTMTIQSGTAAYSGLKVDKTGSYTLTAKCGSMVSPESAIFVIRPGAVYTGLSTIAAGKTSIIADGKDSTTITISLKDAYGNNVTGAAVTLDQGRGTSTITPGIVVSDADGIAVFTVTSTKAERVVYTAYIDNIPPINNTPATGTAEMEFTPGIFEKLGIGPIGTQTAGEPFSVAVTALDHYGNKVPGYTGTVEITCTDGSAVLPSSHAFVPADSGTYTYGGLILKSPGIHTITASDTGASISVISGSFAVLTGPPDAGQSIITSDKASITADGQDHATITVTLRDVSGNPISGATVSLDQTGGSSTVTPATAVSDAAGVAQFDISGTKAENISYRAKVGNNIVTAACIIKLEPGPASQLIWKIQPGGGPAGQIWQQQPMLVLADAFGNVETANSSTEVTLEITSAGAVALQGTRTVILKNGEAVFTGLRIDQTGSYTLTAKTNLPGIAGSLSGSFQITSRPAQPPAVKEPSNQNETRVDAGGNVSVVLSPQLDGSTGEASAGIDAGALTSAFESAGTGADGVKRVDMTVPGVEGAAAYKLTLPESFLTSGDQTQALKVNTDLASVTLPGNMIEAASASGDEDISLKIAAGDKGRLPADIQETIGDRPVIELSMAVGGLQMPWSNDSAPVTVSIPYEPTPEELKDPEHITVWYIDGKGNPVPVPSGRYDPSTGSVTFATTHFSKYAVVFVKKTFMDIGSHRWAREQIEILASKGVISGTSETTFSPSSNITRADFIVLLVRTLGLTAKVDGNFSDVKEGDYYYQAVGIARKLGISAGTGNNTFSPRAAITRQEMMALTAKALEAAGRLMAEGRSEDLEKFSDKGSIASYAAKAIASLVKEGLISGDGSRINPRGNSTRAEVAVLMYKLYNKQ